MTLVLATVSLSGCVDDDQANDLKTLCTMRGFQSNIGVLFEANGPIPQYLSGLVNDTFAFDDCSQSNAEFFDTVPGSDKGTQLILWMQKDSPLYEKYFTKDGKPREKEFIEVRFYGRKACDDEPQDIGHMFRAVEFEAVQANGKNCGLDGYSASVK